MALIPSTPSSVSYLRKRKLKNDHHPEHSKHQEDGMAIHNPFTPIGKRLTRLAADEESIGSIARYQKEFLEIGTMAGSYYRHCFHRLDGCKYTLKKRPGDANDPGSRNEVWAHAALGQHPNIVNYYSAWAEDDDVIIQREFCDGGTLAEAIRSGQQFDDDDLKSILFHICSGLAHIHSKRMVHNDLNATNIFICRSDSGQSAVYKIGGFTCASLSSASHQLDKMDVKALGEILSAMKVNGQMKDLVGLMMHPDPNQIPSSRILMLDPIFDHHEGKSNYQLNKELEAQRRLTHQLVKLLNQLQS